MRLFLYLALVSVNLFLLSSCKNYKPAEAAFFLKAEDISVISVSGQGSGSHKITDLWLYVNGQFKGAYPVGNSMPIVSKGEPVRINLLAGIKKNGIADTRIFSPFYAQLQLDTFVESGKTISRAFSFSYINATRFPLIENFDGSGLTMVKSAITDTSVIFRTVGAPESFEGKSLELSMPSTNASVAQVESASSYTLPIGSANVYLELNYKSNEEFVAGLIGDSGEIPALFIKPQDNWNKIYIELAAAVSTPPTSSKYKVYFRMLKKNAEAPKLFLDNIKLVYLP